MTIIDKLHGIQWIHIIIITLFSFTWFYFFAQLEIEPSNIIDVILYLLAIPYVVLNIWGLSTPRLANESIDSQRRRVTRLHICIVTKGIAPEVVKRSYEKMKFFENDQIKITVVTDTPLDIPHLLVPPDFETKHARYKARALEYFRQYSRFTDTEWVLHLDEESIVDDHCLQECLHFCENSRSLLGQGVILYNNHNFWRYPIPAAADCIRVSDDLGRFHLQYAKLGKPIFGVHGSFLLVNGQLENEVTWDTMHSLVEDYAFALGCMKKGFSCGEVYGIVREQSPKTITDLLRQRRRWLLGIRDLGRHSFWPRIFSFFWTLSPVIKLWAVYKAVFLTTDSFIWGILAICYLYFYLLGSVVQDLDRQSSLGLILRRMFFTTILFPVSTVLEASAVVWSFFTQAKKVGFQIVSK